MSKLAIIGASYLQVPLIVKAQTMGIETHVFAWQCGDIGEKVADFFYPISIVEKEQILEKCKEIRIDGICSIASDLASITVNYVAYKLGLTGNTLRTTIQTTNKYEMKKCFFENSIPSAEFFLLDVNSPIEKLKLEYPVIVKPTDRSGSRGVAKVYSFQELKEAIASAKTQSFEKRVLIENFIAGTEYSVEYISYQKKHFFLALTQKFTTGSPHFIETGHIEPANIDERKLGEIKEIVCAVLDSVGFENGASHTELKIDGDGNIFIIEIGGRMGGDFIGSSLVPISTGIDFVRAVIQIALGETPDFSIRQIPKIAAVRFIFGEKDKNVLKNLQKHHPEHLVEYMINSNSDGPILDSSNRYGYFLMQADSTEDIRKYLPEYKKE